MLSLCFPYFIRSHSGINSNKRDPVIAGINNPVVELSAVGLTDDNVHNLILRHFFVMFNAVELVVMWTLIQFSCFFQFSSYITNKARKQRLSPTMMSDTITLSVTLLVDSFCLTHHKTLV